MKPVYTIGIILLVVVGGSLWYLFATPAALPAHMPSLGENKYKEIANPAGFVNTPRDAAGNETPLTIGELIGKKVILVDFLTYSCINCQRTFPYINAWYDKYKQYGLEIVGIHTPEFSFEKDITNVRQAMKKFGITHPIVLDNDYGTWNAYGNSYWPREYLIDINGNIVYDHAGEGEYDVTESKIRELLTERAKVLGLPAPAFDGLATDTMLEVQLGAASPETYFGSKRNEYLGNGIANLSGEKYFEEPQTVNPNTLYLIGKWNILPEYAETSKDVGGSSVGSDRVNYLYQAKGLYFVAGSAQAVDIEVTLDGKPVPESEKGSDVFYKNGRSYITVKENRLYKLVDSASPEKHLLELIISSPGLQAFTFTFG